ncbi:hypothetical protein BDC45DRAFT_524176 [Circinella umbellata]|nr:hypothetical protein BDC45DRAFT_524176 [Circinella umbellata]
MANKFEIFEKYFHNYIVEEKNNVSLKRFHDFAPDVILSNSQGIDDIKNFWTMTFKKMVIDNNIKGYSKQQPNWDDIMKKIISSTEQSKDKVILCALFHALHTLNLISIIQGSLGKRGREEPADPLSSSLPSSASLSSVTENTPVATSSTESTNKRRKRLTIYLSENMVPGVTLDLEVEKWEVNGVVVSELLLKYREESIKKGEKQMLDTYQEELSLNGIFFI